MKKVVLIIGGSSGIGLAAAKKFVRNSYTVYNGSRNACPDPAVISYTVDVADRTTIEDAVGDIAEREGRLDILVYSAGYSMAAPLEYALERDYRYLFDVNFFGAIAAAQTVIPMMKKQGGGRILYISSVGGILPIAYDAFYSSSKAALNMLAKELNIELNGSGILVTNIMPGGTRTPFTHERNVYSPDDAGEYARDMFAAAGSLAEIEQHGMDAESVADTVYRAAVAEHPPVLAASGLTNKLYHLASRIFPTKMALHLLKRTYHVDQGGQSPPRA